MGRAIVSYFTVILLETFIVANNDSIVQVLWEELYLETIKWITEEDD